MFQLGEDVFISTNSFNDRILIHVRRYKKYGARYYPSKEGVTLTPYQFIHLINSTFLREKSTIKEKNNPMYEYAINPPTLIDPVTVYSDTSVGIQDKIKSHNIIMIEFSETILLKKTSFSKNGNTHTTSITLNDAQWDKIYSIGDFLLDNICHLKFNCEDFKKLFEGMLTHTASVTAPEDDGTITATLKYLLKTEVYKLLARHPNLKNPMEVSPDELSNNTHIHFYEAIINIKPYDIVKHFYDTVKNNTQHPVSNGNLLNFVTIRFLETIDFVEIFQTAKNKFCFE